MPLAPPIEPGRTPAYERSLAGDHTTPITVRLEAWEARLPAVGCVLQVCVEPAWASRHRAFGLRRDPDHVDGDAHAILRIGAALVRRPGNGGVGL